MKLITVLINSRFDHILNFDSQVDKVPNSYIVENNGGSHKLFNFYGESDKRTIKYQTNIGEENLKLSAITVAENDSQGNDEVIVVMDCYFIKDKVNTPVITGKNEICNTKYWSCKHFCARLDTDSRKCYKVTVNFHVSEANNTKITKSIVINIVPKDYIYDMVLDYGSEASQMLIYNRGNTQQVITNKDIVPLFDLFKSSCEGGLDETKLDSDYLQYDSDDRCLYKSQFFAKKTPDANNADACSPFKDSDNVRLFVDVEDLDSIKKKYITIPNIKVATHGGVQLPTIHVNGVPVDIISYRDNYFYRTIVNSFVYQGLRRIDPYQDGKPKYLNIHLLMPNIYTQVGVTNKLFQASVDVFNLAKNIPDLNLKGIEVASVSESDASFLGFMSQLSPQRRSRIPGGRYLIMDAGKGTLDFSVLEYNPKAEQNGYRSIMRSGIIGAGNAITYSFVLAILKNIYKPECNRVNTNQVEQQISKFVLEKITNAQADEAELSKLIRLAEKFKILYNRNELIHDHDISISDLNKLTLEGLNQCLINLVNNQCKLADYSYVDNMIDQLCKTVAIKFKECYGNEEPINRIVFAGRGFQMTKLRERIVFHLKAHNGNIFDQTKEISLTEAESTTSASYKNICLFILGPLAAGRYNGKIVGVPRVLEYTGQDNVSDENNQIDEVENVESPSKGFAINKFIKKIKMPAIVKALIEKITMGSYSSFDYTEVPKEELDFGMIYGFPVSYPNGAADQTIISGFSYALPPDFKRGSAEIFFNGEDFEIRQGEKSSCFGDIVNLDAAYVFESTFPYGYLSHTLTMIPFPTSIVGSRSKQMTITNNEDLNEGDKNLQKYES